MAINLILSYFTLDEVKIKNNLMLRTKIISKIIFKEVNRVMKYFITLSFILTFLVGDSKCFIPAKIMSSVIYKLESGFHSDLGKVSVTLVHDEILKRGLIQSVVAYFIDQPKASNKVNISKISEYYDLRKLYFDYYGKGLCNKDIPLVSLLKFTLQPAVASIDFKSSVKDLPYAHFDAETFAESNQRVIYFKNQIKYEMSQKNWENAREKSGEVLHTIQDFYAHSNWVN